MDKFLFERNLKCIADRDPGLHERLRRAAAGGKRYSFRESRSGELVPAIIDGAGAAHSLHSTVDPRLEAERLISSLCDEGGRLSAGFLVFLGLGGAFAAEAALRCRDARGVLIIDYDAGGIAELLHSRDYTNILGDPRCSVLIDPSPEDIETFIAGHYLPALCGSIRILPLRARTAQEQTLFNAAAAAIERSIGKISSDYSVQAHFGMRWFSNIIRNIKAMDAKIAPRDSACRNYFDRSIEEAAICAAGPSLDLHLPLLAGRKQKNKNLFIMATDTSLPALLSRGVRPDAVVSIDCQHISYYHFAGLACRDITLFLDLASPPLLAGLSDSPVFLSSGHPLTRYSSLNWRHLPGIDTSGGNVTYACLSLAANLGARRITVYGADFSYPQGKVYARGTYIFPFFERKQNRLAPLESLFSSFLYRAPFLAPASTVNYYETASLRFYRERFEEKARTLNARVSLEPGLGPPLLFEAPYCPRATAAPLSQAEPVPLPRYAKLTALEFLQEYQTSLENLPLPGAQAGAYTQTLNPNQRQILVTLLPLSAALKHRRPELHSGELLEAAKHYCISQIEKICAGR